MIVEMSKGRQITIPARIRSQFELDIGSKLEIEKKDNIILLKPIREDINKLFKRASNVKPKHKLSAKKMDELNEALFR